MLAEVTSTQGGMEIDAAPETAAPTDTAWQPLGPRVLPQQISTSGFDPESAGWQLWLDKSAEIISPMASTTLVFSTGVALQKCEFENRVEKVGLPIVSLSCRPEAPPYAVPKGTQHQPILEAVYGAGPKSQQECSFQWSRKGITVKGRKLCFTKDRVKAMICNLGQLSEVLGPCDSRTRVRPTPKSTAFARATPTSTSVPEALGSNAQKVPMPMQWSSIFTNVGKK